jgi:hypothetical protein
VAHRAVGPGSLVASRFRLEDLLEEHSGARFWRATDTVLARNVAIHVIDAASPRADAVLTAARTSATVTDGHILRVLDAVEEGGMVYVVHEWGSGVSLDRMLAEEVLEPRRAAWLVREVADAITVAHRHGVAHGRLLPENVLVTDAGSVKLIGFVVDAVLHGRAPEEPERAAAGDAAAGRSRPASEHESDVLNLGALLYACLTGKWPGHPESLLPEAPTDHGRVCRPRQVRQGVPRQLDGLCDRLVNPDPRTGTPRFETAAGVVSALGAYLGDAVAAAPLPVTDATAFLDAEALSTPRTLGSLGSFDGVRAADGRTPHDADATQPGLPRLDDDPTLDPAPAPTHDKAGGPAGDTASDTAGDTAGLAAGRPHPDHRLPGTGMGAGWVPPHWGPDSPPADTGGYPAVPAERAGSSWLRLAAAIGVVVLILLAVVVGFYLGRSETPADDAAEPTGTPGTRTGQVVDIAAVRDFDPEQDGGDPEENPDLVPLATDGDPATAWETLSYKDGPELAPYKNGVGLLVDLGEETQVGEVLVTLTGSPYDLQLLAAPEGASAPTGVDGLRTVAARDGASGEVALTGDETVVTRYLVVWLTALPQGEGGYRGGVAELVVRS